MRKYRLSCPFGGIGGWALAIGLVIGMILFFGADAYFISAGRGAEFGIGHVLVTILLPCVLALAAVFIKVHRLTEEDKKRIAAAKPPQWERLTEEMIERIRHESFTDFGAIAVSCGIIAVIALVHMLFHLHEETAVYLWIFALLCAVILAAGLRAVRWRIPDERAEFCRIPAEDFTYVPHPPRRIERRTCDTIAVFYLPDGKYRIYLHTDAPKAELCFVRYHGMVHFLRYL